MATKNMSYKKAQLADVDEPLDKFVCDDSGMYFVPDVDMDVTLPQVAVASHTHRVDESRTPLWNQVTYNITPHVTGDATIPIVDGVGAVFQGTVTLQGITDMGTVNDIMQHYYNADDTTTATKIFDLYGSGNRSAMRSYKTGVVATGNVQVEIPLKYENYEDIELMPNWYDPAWGYRIGLSMHMALGKLHNAKGHKDDWYVINITVPYKAHMTDNAMTDLRLTANDGITPLPFYVINNVAGSYASVLVAIPWWFVDKERQQMNPNSNVAGGTYAMNTPSYIYAYYGNAAATSKSDVTLTDETGLSHMSFYDTFSDNSIDAVKWPSINTTTHGTITETSAAIQIDLTGGFTETPSAVSQSITDLTFGTTPFEIIIITDEITPIPTATSTADSSIFRIGADGNNYTQIYLPWTTAPTLGAAAGTYWNVRSRTGGGAASTPISTYKLNGSTTTDRYIKLVHQPSTQTGTANAGGTNAWYLSTDGIHWDYIAYETVNAGPITGNPTISLFYQGAAAVATAKRLRVKGVFVYKTMTRNTYEVFQDHFTNSNAEPTDRWSISKVSAATIAEESVVGSGVSGTPGNLTMSWANTGVNHKWDMTAGAATCTLR